MNLEYYPEVTKKLQELKNAIVYDVAVKNCAGNKKCQLKSAKELLKNSVKVNEYRPLFHKLYKVNNTYQLCDGYVAVVLKNMIEGLELNQEKGEYLDCRTIINRCNPTGCDYEEIKIDVLELEQQAINVKKIKPLSWKNAIHIKNSYFNPIYLLRTIRILGTENVTISVHNSSKTEPAYLKSDLGEAIVLPIRPPESEDI